MMALTESSPPEPGWILPSAGMDDRCDGGEVRPTRPPGKSGGKTTLPIYSERRPNQYMQGFVGERCLEPGNPNRRSPKISDPRVGPPGSDRCSVACSFQPATACDRSGARDRSSHRRGGEAMAAAAYPGTRHQPVLGVRDASGARGVFRCRPHSRAYASKPYPRFKQWTVARPMHAAPMQC